MVAYRFLRPDDMPLIVHAYNTCYRIHYPHLGPMDLEAMKTEVLKRNIWSSSCMVAWEDGEAVGILIGAKRNEGTGLMYLGVKPDYQRRGIASHILRSLSSKLAILGPPALVAEVPEENEYVPGLLTKLGYTTTDVLVDFELTERPDPIQHSAAITKIPAEDGVALLDRELDQLVAWDRTLQALRNLKTKLQCLALLSPDAILACLLYCRDKNGMVQIIRIHSANSQPNIRFLKLLIRTLVLMEEGRIKINKLHPKEMAFDDVTALGFSAQKNYRVFRCEAHSFESIE